MKAKINLKIMDMKMFNWMEEWIQILINNSLSQKETKEAMTTINFRVLKHQFIQATT